MSELKFRKIHIDSRFKSSGTHSQFEYNLTEAMDTPENTYCFCDNVCIPHSFNSVDASNQYLYLAERDSNNTYSVRRLEIPSQNYSGPALKAALLTALNTNLPSGISPNYLVTHTLSTNVIGIAAPVTSVFHILTDDEIEMYDNALYVINKNDPRSMNGVLGNREGGTATRAQDYTYTAAYFSKFLDLLNHHNIYVHSSLASFSTLGPKGQSDIICKVPVSSNYGTTIHHNVSSAQDFCDVGKRSISAISFSIRDAYGHPIDLQGASWSLSLTFAVKE